MNKFNQVPAIGNLIHSIPSSGKIELNQFSQWELKNNHFPRVGIRIEKLLNQFPAVGKYKNLIGHPDSDWVLMTVNAMCVWKENVK